MNAVWKSIVDVMTGKVAIIVYVSILLLSIALIVIFAMIREGRGGQVCDERVFTRLFYSSSDAGASSTSSSKTTVSSTSSTSVSPAKSSGLKSAAVSSGGKSLQTDKSPFRLVCGSVVV